MEKQLPADIDAERSTLGALLMDRDAIVAVAPWLYPEYFYLEKHAWIYEAVLDCYNKRVPPDVRTVSDALRRTDRLDAVGGLPYLVDLTSSTPTAVHVEYYGRVVERTALLRRLIQAGGKIAALGYNEREELEITLDRAEEALFSVSQRRSTQEFVHIGQVVDSFFEQINTLSERRGEVTGLATKFRDLDELTGGLQPSDLIILAARPSVGKCLGAGTRVVDPQSGRRLTIAEAVRGRLPTVYGLSDEGRVRPTAVSAWIDSGIKPCYRVTTLSGHAVEVTGHHPFLTQQGWRPLHDLQVGDRIALPRELPVFGADASWPLDLVRLLAYCLAEGALTGGEPRLTCPDPRCAADFVALVGRYFPVCRVVQSGDAYVVTRPLPGRARELPPTRSNPLSRWLLGLGLAAAPETPWGLPEVVWGWTRERLATLLRTLLSCDGAVYPVDDAYARIECPLGGEQLARDVQHALLRFGIVASIYCARHGEWWVEIADARSAARYQAAIGWAGEKQELFAEQLYAPTLARTVGEAGRAGPREATRAVGAGSPLQSPTPPQPASSPELYWDEIKSIVYLGRQQVYDLTVPDGANFIAEDVCVHNTAYSLQLAYNVALHARGTVGVFSLEMSREQLVQRILAMHTGIDSQKLRSGALRESDLQLLTEGMGVLSSIPLYIDDTPGLTIAEVRSKSRRLQAEAGVDLLIIDYLQLMQGRARENRVNEISEISRGLKGLARELNVPVIALSQLSRAVETRTSHVPMLSDLRESGAIEQDADIVMFIYREELYDPETDKKGIAEIHVAKHRNGPIGVVPLRFDKAVNRFTDLERYRQPDGY
jgi:replicative DNA helicase